MPGIFELIVGEEQTAKQYLKQVCKMIVELIRDSTNIIIFNPGNCNSSGQACHGVGVPPLHKICEIPCYYLGSR